MKLSDPLAPMRARHQHIASAAVDQAATPRRCNDDLSRQNRIDASTDRPAECHPRPVKGVHTASASASPSSFVFDIIIT
jgi:hypothetical protein